MLYVPAALFVVAGERLHVGVVRTLEFGRMAVGLTSTAIGTLAVFCTEEAAPFLFVVPSLPMTLFLTASVSQDGPMIAARGLGLAMLVHSKGGEARRRDLTIIAITLVASAKPVYLPLAALLLLPKSGQMWRGRLFAAGGAAVLTVGRLLIVSSRLLQAAVSSRAHAQIHAIVSHPTVVGRLIVSLARNAASSEQMHELVGKLG